MRISYFFSSFLSIYERPNSWKKKTNPIKEKAPIGTDQSGKTVPFLSKSSIHKTIGTNIPEAIMKAMIKLNILYIIIGNLSDFLVNKW